MAAGIIRNKDRIFSRFSPHWKSIQADLFTGSAGGKVFVRKWKSAHKFLIFIHTWKFSTNWTDIWLILSSHFLLDVFPFSFKEPYPLNCPISCAFSARSTRKKHGNAHMWSNCKSVRFFLSKSLVVILIMIWRWWYIMGHWEAVVVKRPTNQLEKLLQTRPTMQSAKNAKYRFEIIFF